MGSDTGEETRSALFQGRYLFHCHTQLTDGTLSIKDYFDWGRRNDVERIILLEHIRRQPTYDVGELFADVRALSAHYGIDGCVGFEAKLLPSGDLDIADEHIEAAGVVGIAEHGFPHDFGLLREALEAAFALYTARFRSKAFVWVHPGTTYLAQGLEPASDAGYLQLVKRAAEAGIFIEHNLRYRLVPRLLIDELRLAPVVIGANAHCQADLEKWAKAIGKSDTGMGPNEDSAPSS